MIKNNEWDEYFPMLNKKDFASPDEQGSERFMDFMFLINLNQLAMSANMKLKITSGYRTQKYNAKVGGVPSSAHLKGFAADIHTGTSTQRFLLLFWAIRLGFTRIGIYKTFIHLDKDPEGVAQVCWYG